MVAREAVYPALIMVLNWIVFSGASLSPAPPKSFSANRTATSPSIAVDFWEPGFYSFGKPKPDRADPIPFEHPEAGVRGNSA